MAPPKVRTMVMKKSNKNCAICLEKFEEDQIIKKLECEHIFHRMCFKNWMKKSSNCPLCRHNVTQHWYIRYLLFLWIRRTIIYLLNRIFGQEMSWTKFELQIELVYYIREGGDWGLSWWVHGTFIFLLLFLELAQNFEIFVPEVVLPKLIYPWIIDILYEISLALVK